MNKVGGFFMKSFIFSFLILLSINMFSNQFSFDLFTGFDLDLLTKKPGIYYGADILVTDGPFSAFVAMDMRTHDVGTINPNLEGGILGDWYDYTRESYVALNLKTFDLRAGMLQLKEGTGRTYPLFISSNSSPYPAVSISWKPFKWMELKNDFVFIRQNLFDFSKYELSQIPKTLYYRRYALKPLDFLEFGLEDAVLFLGRSLDLIYLFSFGPYQTIQWMRQGAGPWHEEINDNGMIGLYFDLSPGNLRIYADTLIDDVSHTLIGKSYVHPYKIAWDTGIEYRFNENLFYFEFAGATKYTFQRTSMNVPPYQYVRYEDRPDIPLEYNMIGYKYGENSIALNIGTELKFGNFDINPQYEYVALGKRDPDTPWHGAEEVPAIKFSLLDDEVIEKRHLITLGVKIKIFDSLSLNGTLGFAYIRNEGLVEKNNNFYPLISLGVNWNSGDISPLIDETRKNFSDLFKD
jgi:hypothetical protein